MQPSISVDFRQKGSSDRLFDQPPLARSHDSDWRSIHLEHHFQQAIDTPEHVWATPVIVVALNSALQLQGQRDHDPFRQVTQLGIFPAGVPHQYTAPAAEFLAFSINAQAFLPVMNGSIAPELVPTLLPEPDCLIAGVALALKAELAAGCPGGSVYEASLATALAIHLVKHYSVTGLPTLQPSVGLSREKLKLTLDYIHEHFSEKIRLEAIAQSINISPYHFCHLFKASMGVSPYQYILHCRIECAKQLLKNHSLAIVDVALDCGFATQSQLTKYFSRFVGTTPKVYRDQV